MRNVFIIIFIGLSCICNGQSFNDSVLCPQLDSLLSKYIDENKRNYSVVQINFVEYGGVDFVSFYDRTDYDSQFMDGYFYKDGKLITFYSIDTRPRNNYINYKKTFCLKDSIPDYYHDCPVGCTQLSNYESHPKLYLIHSKEYIEEVENVKSPSVKWQKAVGSNAINHKKLNSIINDYINNNYYMLYVLRFNKVDNCFYVSINGASAYDRNEIKAYFFRNGHLVVIYDMNMIPYQDLIVEDEIIQFEDNIKNYRGATMYPDFKNIPPPQKYKFISRNKIKRVSLSNKSWLFI